MSSECQQGHVRKAQALVSLGRTEEALREYLVCLSIEPDCRLAKTEAHKVPRVSLICIFNIFMKSKISIAIYRK